MSSSSRSLPAAGVAPRQHQGRGPVAVLCGCAAGLCASLSSAAEYYAQPIVSASAAYNTNVELASAPTPRTSAVGYFADAESIVGIATPTSETTLVPRLLYNYYPTQHDLDRLEAFLSLNGRYTWQRDRFNVTGYFDHRDDLNAEQPGAQYSTVTPGLNNTTPSTGQIKLGIVRDFLDLQPNYAHYITPLSQIGVAADYQKIHYNTPDTAGHVDYDYYQGRGFYTYTFSPRLDGTVSAFGARYNANNIDSTTTSGGGSASASYAWSQTWNSTLTVGVQHAHQVTDTLTQNGVQFDGNSNPWNASFSTVYTRQIDSYRVDAGRIIAPSSAGGLYRTDQIRGQYTRNFTPRLTLIAAARYFRDGVLTGPQSIASRDYLTTNLSMQYMLTRTFFVAGMYSYVWQKYTGFGAADANSIMVTFGYRGLERQH